MNTVSVFEDCKSNHFVTCYSRSDGFQKRKKKDDIQLVFSFKEWRTDQNYGYDYVKVGENSVMACPDSDLSHLF